jgi:hypothetical protein
MPHLVGIRAGGRVLLAHADDRSEEDKDTSKVAHHKRLFTMRLAREVGKLVERCLVAEAGVVGRR